MQSNLVRPLLLTTALLLAWFLPVRASAVDLKSFITDLTAANVRNDYFEVEAHTQMFEHGGNGLVLATEYFTTATLKDLASPMSVDYHPCRMRWTNGAAPYAEENRTVVITANSAYEITHSGGHSGKFHPINRVRRWWKLPDTASINPLSTGTSFSLFGVKLFDRIEAASVFQQIASEGRASVDGSPIEVSMATDEQGSVVLRLFSAKLFRTELLTLDRSHEWRMTKRESLRHDPQTQEIYQRSTYTLEEWTELTPRKFYPSKAAWVEERRGKAAFSATFTATYQLLEKMTADSVLPVIPRGYKVDDHR